MTKAQLIKALEPYDDDTEIVISYENDTDWHDIHVAKHYPNNHKIMLETREIPCFEALQNIAEALYNDQYEYRPDNHEDKKKLEEFIW